MNMYDHVYFLSTIKTLFIFYFIEKKNNKIEEIEEIKEIGRSKVNW